jgi:hypothetical protein
MNDKDVRSADMVLRVRDFGSEEATAFPPLTLGGQLFATVNAAAIELASHISKQISGVNAAKEGTSTKAGAREALHAAMDRIRRTARAMSQSIPGVDKKFRFAVNLTDQVLLGTAQAFVTAATPLRTEFISYAMPADFIEDLQALITDFERALSAQNVGKEHKVSARAAIEEVLARALAAVRQLDAIVRNVFHDQPAKLAAWESARHIERAPKKNKPAPTTPPANQ